MYGERFGVFPVDSCIATIEVKSKLTTTEIDDTIAKSNRMQNLKYAPGKFSSVGRPLPHNVGVVTRALFAFESDMLDKDELVRYGERDTNYQKVPKIKTFCVMGKGTWCFNHETERCSHTKPTSEYDEVIVFLASIIVDNLVRVFESRGRPKIGPYMLPEKGTMTITWTKPVKKIVKKAKKKVRKKAKKKKR